MFYWYPSAIFFLPLVFSSPHSKKFTLFVTTEILSEYEEVISYKLSPETASSVIRTLIELENVIPTTVYFKYQLIRQDPDEDKFCKLCHQCEH